MITSPSRVSNDVDGVDGVETALALHVQSEVGANEPRQTGLRFDSSVLREWGAWLSHNGTASLAYGNGSGWTVPLWLPSVEKRGAERRSAGENMHERT